ncbi:MAG: hypothetical protein WC641_07770 [Patescibacteria group bacterium]
MSNFLVFGSHPRLSLAEITALRPNAEISAVCGKAVLINDPAWDGPVLMNLLGGTVKLGVIAAEMPWQDFSAARAAEILAPRLRGKRIDFGWTVYGGAAAAQKKLSAQAIAFKKELRARSLASRWVTGKNNDEITPAAVAKLKLTTEGLDVCLLVHGTQVALGYTSEVQDADAWSLRDYGRPARDELNGMLPPKLARIMVNLARVPDGGTLLDPFCGGGTILMEAALASQAKLIIGSDIAAKQIADTQKNIAWLLKEKILRPDDAARFALHVQDVRRTAQHLKAHGVDRVVTEGYLGPPLKGNETKHDLEKSASAISDLWRDSLRALLPTLAPQAELVCIWPGFLNREAHAFVNLEPELQGLGYALVPFFPQEKKTENLIYKRPDQRVSRRLVKMRPLSP